MALPMSTAAQADPVAPRSPGYTQDALASFTAAPEGDRADLIAYSDTLRSLAFLQWLATQAEQDEPRGLHAAQSSIHALGQQLMSLRLNARPQSRGTALLSTSGSDEAAGGGVDLGGDRGLVERAPAGLDAGWSAEKEVLMLQKV
jgi:hypothetical protein